MLVLLLKADEAEDVATGTDTVVTPVVDLTLAADLDAGVEVVVLEIILTPVVLALTDPGAARAVAVASTRRLSVALVLVVLPPLFPPGTTIALYALSAAPSALLTAAFDIGCCVPSHAVFITCSGAVKNSGKYSVAHVLRTQVRRTGREAWVAAKRQRPMLGSKRLKGNERRRGEKIREDRE